MSDAYRAVSLNTVIVKDDIGKAKRTVYDLPHEAHAYGRAEQPDMEGAREVVMSWASHVPRPRQDGHCQDFIRLNKMAPREKVATAKQGAEFRRNTSVPLAPSGPVGAMPKVIPSDVIPSFAYGRKSRPSTPISSVLGAHYAAEHEGIIGASYDRWDRDRVDPESKHKVRLNKNTKSQIALARARRGVAETPEEKELFKMTKFKKVPSRLLLAPLAKSSSMPNLGQPANASSSLSRLPNSYQEDGFVDA